MYCFQITECSLTWENLNAINENIGDFLLVCLRQCRICLSELQQQLDCILFGFLGVVGISDFSFNAVNDLFDLSEFIKDFIKTCNESREGLLGDILGVLSAQKVPIRAVSAKTDKEEATIVVSVQVNGTDVLDNIIKKIKTYKDVQDVYRT